MRKVALVVASVVLFGTPVTAQTCHKVVSFALADASGVRPFMGTGNWIGKWVQKNAKKYQDICFSQTALPRRANYLVVLSQSAGYLTGIDPVLRTNTSVSTSPVSGSGTITDSYGGTWNYSYTGTETTTTTTTTEENLPYTISTNTIYANAYGASGAIISQRYHVFSTRSGGDPSSTAGYNLGSALAAINARGRLLSAVVKDVAEQPVATIPAEESPSSAAPVALLPSSEPSPQSLSSAAATQPSCKIYPNTGEKESITENADGKVLFLSDGSMWEVIDIDKIDSSLWLPVDDVVVIRSDNPIACFNYTMINASEDAEKVQVQYLGQR